MEKQYTKNLQRVIRIDEGRIKEHLADLVRGSVEKTLNNLEKSHVLVGLS